MVFKKIARALLDHTDLVCTVAAGIGVVATAYLSAKAGAKSIRDIDYVWYDRVQETGDESDLDPKEKFELCWKNYIPPIVAGGITILNIAGGYNAGRAKYLTALSAVSALASRDTAVKMGATDAQKEKLYSPLPNNEMLVYEPYTQQSFMTTKEEIIWAELNINKFLQNNTVITLNQLLMLFKNAKTYPIGEDLGWDTDNEQWTYGGGNGYSFSAGLPWIDFVFAKTNVNGRDLLTLGYGIEPYNLHVVI